MQLLMQFEGYSKHVFVLPLMFSGPYPLNLTASLTSRARVISLSSQKRISIEDRRFTRIFIWFGTIGGLVLIGEKLFSDKIVFDFSF